MGEVVDFSIKTNSLSRANLSQDSGEIKNIHYGDILVKFNSVLDLKTEKLPFINSEYSTLDKFQFLKDGDLVFADAAEDNSVGKCIEVRGVLDDKVTSGLHTIAGTPKMNFASFYLGYYLNSNNYHDKILPLIQGTKVSSISKNNLTKSIINYPKNFEEQQKIGKLFIEIDQTITLLQRKIDNLKKVKKGLLQKFFPLEQSINPQVRFSGFNQDWEQRNISEISKVFIGLVTTMTSNYSDKGTLLIRNSDIKDGYFEFNEKPIYLTEEFANKNISRMHQVGDVITVHTGDVGTSAVINEKEKNSIGFATIVTRPNQNILSPDFLSTFLNTSRHKNWALSVSTGDGRVNYNLKDYKRTMINVPSIEEQKQISSVIKNINLTITLLQKELEMNNQIKKGFLQKLFPKE